MERNLAAEAQGIFLGQPRNGLLIPFTWLSHVLSMSQREEKMTQVLTETTLRGTGLLIKAAPTARTECASPQRSMKCQLQSRILTHTWLL